MPGKTFWVEEVAKDFEAPIKPLAFVQVMVFPSPQLQAASFPGKKERKSGRSEGGAASSPLSMWERA
jgi:hypothetical protein